jgi:hypothetical protein
MAATMTTTPRSVNDATPLSNDTTLHGARSAMMTPRLGDDANLGDVATQLGVRLVMMTPSSEMLGNNTTLCDDDATLGKDAKIGNDATPLGNNTKLVAQTLQCHAWQRHQHHAW